MKWYKLSKDMRVNEDGKLQYKTYPSQAYWQKISGKGLKGSKVLERIKSTYGTKSGKTYRLKVRAYLGKHMRWSI